MKIANFISNILFALMFLISTSFASDVNNSEMKCKLASQINFDFFLGKKIVDFKKYLNEVQDENPEYMGLYLLKKKFYKRFGLGDEISEVSIDIYQRKIISITVGDFRESQKFSSLKVDQILDGCGDRQGIACWKIGKYYELDASEFPRLIRFSDVRAVNKFFKKELWSNDKDLPCSDNN